MTSSMTSSAIKPYPAAPIAANLPIAAVLADALLVSVNEYRRQLHGRRIWLACSGGRDSLALAAICLQLYRQGKLPFLPQLLHVDHNLQAGSQLWAQHVAKWAAAQQMSCTILQAQVDGHDEQAARQARYQIMGAHINQEDVLLLAHHADDQAETVLMRLIQGAGVKGLSGMQSWRVTKQGEQQSILWRPWLSVRRAAISRYAKQLKLPYINDPTNDSGDNVRSSLRCDVIPLLTTYNNNVIENIARSAQLLSDAQAIVSEQANKDMHYSAIERLCYPPVQRALDIDLLQTLPIYRQRQLLHHWLAQDEPLPPNKQLIDDVLSLTQRADHDHQTQLDWQGRYQHYSVRRYRQQLYRLSETWLTWLELPLAESKVLIEPFLPDSHSATDQSLSITLRDSDRCHWQLIVKLDHLLAFINANFVNKENHNIALQVAPLDRQQRLQTALATRPQAGKKLYQTLGVPVWLRDSLIVVSVIDEQTGEKWPLLLLSPFESWVLGVDKLALKMTNTDNLVDSIIRNVL
ncbi:tRNA lysidine(34) synthetase TilS [uncultured Psychrobacter sp.]|uniref:tRNA lysidine(34) synthetase TilS n=1 Tax=uncultured Psychrobacter sp. TaxID=259303 RepID=UPI003458DE64